MTKNPALPVLRMEAPFMGRRRRTGRYIMIMNFAMSQNKISIGSQAPDFSLNDQNGKEVSLKGLLSKGPLVLYFYPKDETPGCTKEACSFRDQYEDFKSVGAQVIGVSSDSVDSHRRFTEHYRLPFILLSDVGGAVRKQYGVPSTLGLLPGRVTYVIDRQGIIRYVFSSQFNAVKHTEEALKVLKELDQ